MAGEAQQGSEGPGGPVRGEGSRGGPGVPGGWSGGGPIGSAFGPGDEEVVDGRGVEETHDDDLGPSGAGVDEPESDA